MVRINLETLPLCKLFEEYGLSLEVLGTDLLNLFKSNQNDNVKHLYLQAFAFDIDDMINSLSSELTYDDVLISFYQLTTEIEYHMRYVRLDPLRLVNIQFSGIDTLILEYRT